MRDAQQRARIEQWMDWQATEFNNAWRYAFSALVKKSPAHQDAGQIAAGIASWNRHAAIVERHLAQDGAFMTGATFTLADIVIGLSLRRWKLAPIARPALPAIDAYLARLAQRPGYLAWAADWT